MQKPVFLESHKTIDSASLISEIEAGLLAKAASISPKFLYDDLGAHLFTALTFLPEYYPTATETRILKQYETEIAVSVGPSPVLIDLGAGDCKKATRLFASIKPSSYVAIDFSVDYLKEALDKLQNQYPDIPMFGVGMDFSQTLKLPDAITQAPRTFFYPGSSLGNFLPTDAEALLKQIKREAMGGGLLLGVDLMKAEHVLQAAYDDPLKVTAAFNLNILRSVNAIIDSNFDVSHFCHKVVVNHAKERVELYLEALRDTTVTWSGKQRVFKKGELIHTENSHKYSIASIQTLLNSAGFQSIKVWTDPQQYFAVIYAQ
jgi:dimethylhistidine N-methyltransferase